MTNFQERIFNEHPVKRKEERSDIIVKSLISNIMSKNDEESIVTILDIGCGGGQLLEAFVKNPSIDIFGIDVSTHPLKIAKDKGYKCILCDVETDNLPFNSKFFDLIIVNDLLEHIIDPDNLLVEIHRILQDKGNLIVTIPNISHPVSWFMQIFFDLPPMQSARYKSVHVRDYTLRILKIVLKIHGFNIKKIYGTYLYPFDNKIGRLLANLIPRISEKIIFTSEKTVIPDLAKKDVFFNTKELLRISERI